MSHQRKYQTLPNLRALKKLSKDKGCNGANSRSLFDALWFSFSGGDKAMKRAEIIQTGKVYSREKRSSNPGEDSHVNENNLVSVRNVYSTHGDNVFLNKRDLASCGKNPHRDGDQADRLDDDCDPAKDRRKSREKKSKKSRRSELESIISEIHSNLACREQLPIKDSQQCFQESSGSYLLMRSPATDANFPDSTFRRSLPIEEPRFHERSKRNQSPRDNKSLGRGQTNRYPADTGYEGEMPSMNYEDNRRDHSLPSGTLRSREKQNGKTPELRSQYVYEYSDIIDQNEDLFRELQALESSGYIGRKPRNVYVVNNKPSLHGTKGYYPEGEVSNGKYKAREIFYDSPQFEEDDEDPRQLPNASSNSSNRPNGGDDFCDIIYDDHHPSTFSIVDNVAYFTADDLDRCDDDASDGRDYRQEDEGEEDGLLKSPLPPRRRVSGRRDRGVWTDTLLESESYEDGGGASTRVEGRSAGWWRSAGPRKDFLASAIREVTINKGFATLAKRNKHDDGCVSSSNVTYDKSSGPTGYYDSFQCSGEQQANAQKDEHSQQPLPSLKRSKLLRKTGSKRLAVNDSIAGVKNSSTASSASPFSAAAASLSSSPPHEGGAETTTTTVTATPATTEPQAERVSEYEQFFASLVVDTHPDHPDRPPLYRHHQTATNLVCARDASGCDGELERIQELFPHDSLRLHDPHPTTQKMKGLMRKRSTTAARLHRAFSAKGSRGQGPPDQPPPLQHANGYANGSLHNTSDFNTSYNGSNSVNSSTNTGYHDASTECLSPGLNNTTCSNGTPYNNKQQQNYQQEATAPTAPRPKRHFIMETPVQFTTGVQSQERHLFLFSDLLLVAKSRSGGNFKLKEKVRVSEMWLASCLEDVAEVSKSHDTSFVMGWPTTNVVATFSCVQTKDLWYNKLAQVVAEEKEGSPPTNIQVSYTDAKTSVEICKTVSITVNTNARECVSLILDHLEMRDVDVTKFQLWVKTPHDDSPYPLIGHEFPLSIKYNNLRDTAQECGTEHLNNLYNNGTDIKFVLRPDGKVGVNGSPPENVGKKVSKKARKSPIRNKLFKRSASKGDSVDGPAPSPPGILFGHPLFKLAEANGGALPKPVMEMLTQLFQKGPFTEGIFRKSANARLVREMREKLDSGCPTDLSSTNITAVAALFKDFLRSLPDALLNCQLHDDWLDVPRLPTIRDQISRTLLLCSRLPRSNLLLLQHFLCVLHHITRRSKTNKMSASNLAVCVGPSVLWSSPPVLSFSAEVTKQHSSIVEFLIDRFGDIFGEAMLRLMGDPPEQDPARQDSGAEETDSMHSCNGRRDDSSIDSLERDLEGLSPLPRKDKMSLTNLSRDSGLTMSDTQLYTPDEEESESTSSGHSSGDKSMPYAEHRPVERVAHYPAPNNPNAIYTAVCRRPEKPLSYDEPENYYATPSREHTRVQITYSSPCNPTSNRDLGSHTYSQERLMDSQRMMYDSDGIYSVPNTEHQLQLQEIENMNSNFQRDDWMRRKSNLRKVCKTNSSDGGGLTRSTSEESLLSKCNNHEYGLSLSAGGPPPALSCEERSRSPPSIEYDDSVGFMSRDSAIRRSRSAHYLAEVRREKLKDKSDEPPTIVRSSSQDTFSFLRSRSTPHIQDEGDRSYDSSTLSDDDSTPHVSRSNSRGKECGSTGAPSWDATLTPSDSGNSRNSSFKSERTGSVCTVVSAGSCSTLASNPPSYEEALNRRSIMQQQSQRTGTPPQFTEYAIREEKLKAARAKQLYADSLKQYQETAYSVGDIVRASPAHTHDGDDTDSPPPLPPKGDPPPLPPKQRASRRGMNDSASRLKHHPPVHVETQSRKQKLSSTPSPQSSGFGQTMHKTIIYTDVGPPNLPPKERTVIEVVESTSESDRVRQQTVRTVSPRQTVEKKSIETQTDECDLGDSDDLRDGDSQTSDSWLSDHITSVHVPDSSFNYGSQNNSNSSQNRNNVSCGNDTSVNNSNGNNNQKRSRGRPRRRDSSASQRSRSVPSRDSVTVMHSASDSEDDEWEYPAASHEYHSSSAAINYGLRDFRNFDAELRHELTWSVSQLRARFGESHKGAKVHPPPYRPQQSRAPITSYHLGAGDTFCRKTTPSRPQSTYGEESYV